MNLLDRLKMHRAQMAPHQLKRQAGRLIVEAIAELENSINQNDLLAAIARRGFDINGLDGDEAPEEIIANWISSTVDRLRECAEFADKERDEMRAECNRWEESCRFNSDALMEALRQSDKERLEILELREKLEVAKAALKYYTHAVSPLSQVAIDTLAQLNSEEKYPCAK